MKQAARDVLVAIDMPPRSVERLQVHYTVHVARTPEEGAAAAREHGAVIGAVLTNGLTGLSRAMMEALPRLGIVCTMGVGHENVDLGAARERGIVVANGAGGNAACVADHAVMLMLAILRDVRTTDAIVRAGGWRRGDTMRPRPSGKRVGILGFGDIGRRIARRCEAFDMTIAYHGRRPVPDAPYPYVPSPLALADRSDVLMVAVPGGAATRHMIGRAELDALGAEGFLVNVGRGSVVDTAALIEALSQARLAGAALDVIEGEPAVPEALRDLPNVLLTPHMAGRSPESAAAAIQLLLDNLAAHFAGRPVLRRVA